jgi:hypothetical protein
MGAMGDRHGRAALLHPIAVGALALLLVNDHVLKAAAPGWVTGKLSDVAALALTPLVVAALWQALGKRHRAEARIAIAVGVWFASVKILPPANDAYAVLVGLLGWPLAAVGDVAFGRAIQPIALAPTVLDPGDLIALPAVAIGWWLSIGAPRRWSPGAGADQATDRRTAPSVGAIALVGRIAVLAAALVALAATSASVPRTLTSVAQDIVTVTGGGDAVRRVGSVLPAARPNASAGPEAGASVRVQARPRWPFNDPPMRFSLTVAGFGSAVGSAPVVAIPPERCNQQCQLPVEVTIDWPDGAGRGSTSVAWELAVTTDAGSNGYLSAYSNGASIDGAARTSGDGGWLLGFLAIAPLVALAVASESRSRAVAARPGSARLQMIATAAASIGVAAVLVLTISILATAPGIGTVLGGRPDDLGYLGFAAVVAIGWGLYEWRTGSGVVLAVALATTGLIGLPVAGFLVAVASPSFAGPWLLIGFVLAGLLTLGVAGATLRPGDAARPPSGGQLIVLSTQVAVVTGLIVSGPGIVAGGALLAAVLHAVAVLTWWGGTGRWLGLTSVLIAGGTGATMFMRGPTLFGGEAWSPTSTLLQVGVLVGCVVGLGAAIGAASRRDPEAEDAAAAARIRELVAESPLAAQSGENPDPESSDR